MDNLIEPRRHRTGWLQLDLTCTNFTCICHSSRLRREAVRVACTLLPARSLRLPLPRIGQFGCVVAPFPRDTHCDFQSNLRLSTAAGHSKPALHTSSKRSGQLANDMAESLPSPPQVWLLLIELTHDDARPVAVVFQLAEDQGREQRVTLELTFLDDSRVAVALTPCSVNSDCKGAVAGDAAGPCEGAACIDSEQMQPMQPTQTLEQQHEQLLQENARLEALVRQLEYGTAKSSRKCVQDASGPPSEEAQQRYLFALQQLHQLLGEKAEAAAAAQAALEPEQRQLAAAAADARARRDALLLFIRDVAAASAKAASDGRIKAAVPAAAVQHFLSSEPGKAAEVRALRAAHSRLVHRVAAAERRLKAADHLSAEGLHLVDYEQLRIENAGLAAKREARLAEVEKLRGRLAQAVQISAHVQEKLHFVAQQRGVLTGRLAAAEAGVHEARAQLTASRQRRDQAQQQHKELAQSTRQWGTRPEFCGTSTTAADQSECCRVVTPSPTAAPSRHPSGRRADAMSDSEDDVPLAMRAVAPAAPPAAQNGGAGPSKPPPAAAASNGAVKAGTGAHLHGKQVVSDSDSEDEQPLAARAAAIAKPAAAAAANASNGARPSKPPPAQPVKAKRPGLLDDAVELPAARPKPKPKPAPQRPAAKPREESDEDDSTSKTTAKRTRDAGAGTSKPKERKRKAGSESEKPERASKRGKSEGSGGKGGSSGKKMWDTLVHSGVLFPPEYEPHGVKMLYDGVPVDLTPEQEEVATFFAVMKETDYMKKPKFLENFWEGFREVLGPRHVIKGLDKCDFTPIYEFHMAERERKKNMSKEEKEAAKKEKEEKEAKYKTAIVDGRHEMVGNFRVEPPGLFRGRGEHPKMGKIKKRIYPQDITLNIGRGVPVPEHPFPGQSWKEVRHDQTVTWLAYWRDPVNTKEYKYVFLAATSTWKSESDLQKYEKARKLKDFIGGIRDEYTRNWNARDRSERQMATALYFIDKLALRAGHEKDEDEADTVGCCTLKVDNVECIAPNHIRFDFLGKDSIRYENTVEVEEKVFENISLFKQENASGKPKKDGDQLFECFDAQDLNVRLKDLMDGLSVKVFRTYNASVTLDRLLADVSEEETVEAKAAEYNRANKEVAILCNHQRSVPKTHDNQMKVMQEKLDAMRQELQDLQADLKRAEAGKKGEDGKVLKEDSLRSRVEKKKLQLAKAEIAAASKEDLKTVALGTSKINYLDPRITVAWCKRNEVPIEKVFNKSLLSKFLWSMDVEPAFRF
ncbi:DNA topoisomerase 1 beta [Chlorella vulgaris]